MQGYRWQHTSKTTKLSPSLPHRTTSLYEESSSILWRMLVLHILFLSLRVSFLPSPFLPSRLQLPWPSLATAARIALSPTSPQGPTYLYSLRTKSLLLFAAAAPISPLSIFASRCCVSSPSRYFSLACIHPRGCTSLSRLRYPLRARMPRLPPFSAPRLR